MVKKWYAFTTLQVQRWAIENMHREEAEIGVQKTEFVQSESDPRIVWIDDQTNEDPVEAEEAFERLLTDLNKENYVIIPLPPMPSPENG